MSQRIEINLIGDITYLREGKEIPLISSRKTRALLAYLLITAQAHRREHLCELFFDTTDDPRGALRWSLSKLRRLLNDGDHVRLISSNDTVRIDMTDISLDAGFVRAVHEATDPDVDDLRRAAGLLAQRPLAGLDLHSAEDYQAWLMGEREEMQSLRGGIICKLMSDASVPDHEAIKWLRNWYRLEPFSHDAPRELWQKLTALRRKGEAKAIADQYAAAMGEDALDLAAGPVHQTETSLLYRQKVGFCISRDNVRIAYADVGKGPVLVKAANWLNHLELDWHSPIWADTFRALAAHHRFIRYDERGNGLSDWDVPEISFESFVTDLDAVVNAHGLDRFPLLGMSQGCAVSIAYAVRHPERVSALVLIGGYARGWRIGMSAEEIEQREAVLTLTRLGWGTSNPAYRHIFSQTFMPDADADRLAWFDDFQRQTTSAENAVRFQEAFGDIDVLDQLEQVRAPTLVLHARGDQRIGLDHGLELAARIPNARLVTLESRNHIILGDEPAWQVCMDEVLDFLKDIK